MLEAKTKALQEILGGGEALEQYIRVTTFWLHVNYVFGGIGLLLMMMGIAGFILVDKRDKCSKVTTSAVVTAGAGIVGFLIVIGAVLCAVDKIICLRNPIYSMMNHIFGAGS